MPTTRVLAPCAYRAHAPPATTPPPPRQVMLIPEKDPKADLIMVATGTGIAPYRSMIRRLFVEKTPCTSRVE